MAAISFSLDERLDLRVAIRLVLQSAGVADRQPLLSAYRKLAEVDGVKPIVTGGDHEVANPEMPCATRGLPKVEAANSCPAATAFDQLCASIDEETLTIQRAAAALGDHATRIQALHP